ncbi:hypothetical protein MHYP_G00148210 [Metynnis hypsauchen]
MKSTFTHIHIVNHYWLVFKGDMGLFGDDRTRGFRRLSSGDRKGPREKEKWVLYAGIIISSMVGILMLAFTSSTQATSHNNSTPTNTTGDSITQNNSLSRHEHLRYIRPHHSTTGHG